MKLSRRSLLSSGAAIVPVAGLGPAIAAADGFRSPRLGPRRRPLVPRLRRARQGSEGLHRPAARLQVSNSLGRERADEIRRRSAVAARRHGGLRGAERRHRARAQPRAQHGRRRGRWRDAGAAHRGRHVRPRSEGGRHVDAARRPRPPARQGLGELGRHADELRGRPDAVGHLAHVRGGVRHARQAARLRVRGGSRSAAATRCRSSAWDATSTRPSRSTATASPI